MQEINQDFIEGTQYSILPAPKYILRRFDDKRGSRFYFFKDDQGEVQIASGVTSAFGMVSTENKHLDDWKRNNPNWKEMLDNAAEYGTLEHILFADILLGKKIDYDIIQKMEEVSRRMGNNVDQVKKDILAFLKFKEEYNPHPLLIEGQLVWRDPETGEYLAMTIDLLASITEPFKSKVMVEDGVYSRGDKKGQPKYKEETVIQNVNKTVIIDYKSNFFEKESKSFFEGHKNQLIAASKAVFQNYGVKVDEVFNFSPNAWRDEPSYTLKKWKIDDSDLRVWDAYWRLILVKGYNKPNGRILVVDETFKSSASYEYLSYRDYVNRMIG